MLAKYTIQHAVYQGSADADGYPTGDMYADPVSRPAYGWYPLSSQLNPSMDYDRRIITSKVVGVPDVSPYSPRDRIALPGGDINDDAESYFVSEDVRDYTTGPFSQGPGGEIVIELVTG